MAVVGWGGFLLGHDPYVLAAAMLAGGVWGALLSLPALRPAPLQAERHSARNSAPPNFPPGDQVEEEIRIGLPCPSCGATVTFAAYHGMAQCLFCSSRHLVQRSDTTLFTVVPNTVTSESDVAAAVIGHLRHLK